ncbi:MAG: putative 2-dehydropantoate 2-reductase [Verrucomicrobiae bacterium]|nr:putative 2-dehydropantoate 2-reductase [Verrucomicrobiae bacterium]
MAKKQSKRYHTAMPRSYAILGTGALGGFYGARLQRAGLDVHFLLRSDYEHVRQHGLRVESADGDFLLPRLNAYNDVRAMPQCDVVCVTLKATQNHLLPALLPHVLKNDGLVVMMQNGLGNEEQAAEVVGAERVAGGLCFICSNKIGPGHIRHLDYGYVRFGQYNGNPTDRLRAVATDFRQAGLDAECVEDLQTARWRKLVWNIPYNGLSVLLRASTAELMQNPHTRALVEAIMCEVVAAATARGCQIPPDFIRKMLADTDRMKPYKTSMMLDFEARRPMEVEAIYGNPLRAARSAGVKTPLLEMLYAQLKFLDAANTLAKSDAFR